MMRHGLSAPRLTQSILTRWAVASPCGVIAKLATRPSWTRMANSSRVIEHRVSSEWAMARRAAPRSPGPPTRSSGRVPRGSRREHASLRRHGAYLHTVVCAVPGRVRPRALRHGALRARPPRVLLGAEPGGAIPAVRDRLASRTERSSPRDSTTPTSSPCTLRRATSATATTCSRRTSSRRKRASQSPPLGTRLLWTTSSSAGRDCSSSTRPALCGATSDASPGTGLDGGCRTNRSANRCVNQSRDNS